MKIAHLAMFALSPLLFAQSRPANKTALNPSTIYVGMDLQLGMSRDAVIAQLAKDYQVVKIQGSGDNWMVEEKNNPLTMIGSLGFTNEKLTYAAKDWIQGDEDGFTLAKALRGAMSAMENEGHHSCYFETPSSRSPVAEMTYLRFYCGSKRINIMTTDVPRRRRKRALRIHNRSSEFRKEPLESIPPPALNLTLDITKPLGDFDGMRPTPGPRVSKI